MKKRITELDSLRGLAAITVLLGHILNTFPPLPKILLYSPLRIFWSAHEAVILFFILSGFVLTIPFLKLVKINYSLYLVKRILRIYIPYIIAICSSLLLIKVSYQGAPLNIKWVQNFWTNDINLSDLINHFILIDNFNTDAINPVIWSLVHEMRISIIFPIIVFIVIKLHWNRSLMIAVTLSIIGCLISFFGLDTSKGYLTSYAHTVHYMSFFIIGSLLAKNKEIIIEWFGKFSFKIQSLILVFGIVIYTMQIGLGYFIRIEIDLFVREWFIATGAVIFIIAAISINWLSELLSTKTINFLGDISYSLYLYHLPILIATFYFLHNFLPQPFIILIALPIIFAISTLSFKIVEKNTIKYGQLLTKKWSKKNEIIVRREIN